MSSAGYQIRNQFAVHFLTFATVQWVDVFTRADYANVIFSQQRLWPCGTLRQL